MDGDARIVGVLTVGRSSVTIDGNAETVSVGIVTITNATVNIGDDLTHGPEDCAGTFGGSLVDDACGVCDGSGYVDNCGVCDDDASNDCVQDCAGTWGGTLTLDDCGVCDGGNADDLGCGCFEAAPSGCDSTCAVSYTHLTLPTSDLV